MELNRWIKHQWDRAGAAAVVAVGLLALLLGWMGVSNAKLATQQIPYLASGGLIGLFLLGVGATLWLSADLRDEWRKLDDINESIRAAAQPPAEPLDAPADAVSNGAGRAARPIRAGRH